MKRLSVALLALVGCSAQPAPKPQNAPGLPRVMSMNPCLDAILREVADPMQIVSISHYSHMAGQSAVPPGWARRLVANSGTAEEAIAARPDVVLIGNLVPEPTQRAIRAAGVKVAAFGVPETIAQSRAQVMEIATALGQAERGRALVARIDAALANARPKRGAAMPVLIRMASGTVVGAGTITDELLTRTGFRNLSGDYGLGQWGSLPLEPLLMRPPQLLLTDTGLHPVLRKVRGLRVAAFPERLLNCAGPGLIEAAARLRAIRSAVRGA
jgi:iron complex transport system substrate-binding protein